MTLGELRAIVGRFEQAHDGTEVKVWLPGSRISLNEMGNLGLMPKDGVLLIEGNVDEGSALCSI